MKTIILIACCFITVTTFSQSKQDVLNQMSVAGDQHNQALDAVFSNLSANSAKLNSDILNKDKIDILIGIENSTIPTPASKSAAGIKVNTVSAVNNIVLQSLAQGNTISQSDLIINNTKLSPDELVYYNRLINIISADNNNLTALDNDIDVFNDGIFQTFGTNSSSTYILIAASSVAKSSAHYWSSNSPKWISLGGQGGTGRVSCCGGVVAADASGAVSGAVAGTIAGAAAGGVGALPGAVTGALAGGIALSAASGVTALIHWLWP